MENNELKERFIDEKYRYSLLGGDNECDKTTSRGNYIKRNNICMKFLKCNEKFGNKCYNKTNN